ncbi:nucleotidyltransferase family protein [Candidatus Thiosymbion oneisti]|uniref:nucleotidyltransferase family protein n=1 Tax=Candidatus Thiosymbion oneisti TaxID=589554 RepID=UPI000A6CF761|nr:nucleotidyltransferase family protein [Candidatus Thiosymbion oneisti]
MLVVHVTELVGVLLAAGSARRFGAHKLLAELPNGEPVGLRAARNLVQVLPDSLAVIRPGDKELAERLAATGIELIENPDAATGIAGSIRVGVSARSDAGGWLIALADMPWIRPVTIRSIADALRAGAAMAAPTCGGRRGHPVGFSARRQSQLMSLSGDRGARRLLEAAGPDLCLVETSDTGILRDIDTPSDLVAFD